MANDNTLNVRIGAVITDLEKNLKNATKSLEKFSDKAKVVGRKMQSTGISMSKAITVPLTLLGGVALKAAADLETLETSLSVMTGSAEKGKAIMKDLAEFTAKTPFQLEGVGNTAKQLLAFGFTTQQVKTNLQFLGDAAAGSGNDLGSLGQIFGQVSAAGKLTAERLNQLNERAIPIGAAIAKTMGIAETSVREMVTKGKVDFATFEKAFRSLSEEGGIFAGAMEKQSKTLAGVLSTLRDNVQLALGSIGEEIVKAFDLKKVLKDLIEGIQKIVKWFSNLDDSTKKTIVKVVAFVAALGPLLTIIGLFTATVLPGLITAFGFLSGAILTATGSVLQFTGALLANPIGAVVVAIALLVKAFVDVVAKITPAVSKFKTFINLVKSGGNHARFVALQMSDQAAAMVEQQKEADASAKATARLNEEQKLAAQNAARLTALLSGGGGGGTPKVSGFKAVVSQLETFKGQIAPIANEINQTIANSIPSADQITLKTVEMQAALIAFNESASQIIQGGIADTFAGLGQAIGQGLSEGGNILQVAGSALLGSLGTILVDLGKMAITIGVGLLGIKTALKTLNPVAAIAAGIGLVALGSFFSSQASSIGDSMGSGGGGSSSTASDSGGSSFSGGSSGFSGGGSSGGTFVFEIAGTKLIGVMKNTLDRNRALGGSDNLLFG